jgi:hypothetical protein
MVWHLMLTSGDRFGAELLVEERCIQHAVRVQTTNVASRTYDGRFRSNFGCLYG